MCVSASLMFVLGDSDSDCLVGSEDTASVCPPCGHSDNLHPSQPRQPVRPRHRLHHPSASLGFLWLRPAVSLRAPMVGPGPRVLVRPWRGWCVESCVPVPRHSSRSVTRNVRVCALICVSPSLSAACITVSSASQQHFHRHPPSLHLPHYVMCTEQTVSTAMN